MRDSIAVYSLWRDSEPHIKRTLSQLEDLESLDYDFEYYFYENDSKDNTVRILRDWLSNRKGNLLSEKLNAKKFGSVTDVERMEFLCECRNKCKNLLKDSTSEYTILIDSDIYFSKENLQQHIKTIESIEDAVMITPNVRQNIPDFIFNKTDDSYYDVYPFFDMAQNRGLYFTDCPFKNGADRMRWIFGKPIKCLSAFGGFVLIKTKILKEVSWSTKGECDHVEFCLSVNRYGSIYIDPQNKVKTVIDLSKLNLENCKQIAKTQPQQ